MVDLKEGFASKMEIELKYLCDKKTALEILGDDYKVIEMDAVYYDTKDMALSSEKLTLRARKENDDYIATIKWGGKATGGMHVRNEINMPVDRDYINEPVIDLFWDTVIYDTLDGAVGGQYSNALGVMVPRKKLLPYVRMTFTRLEKEVKSGNLVAVMSYDEGKITKNGKNLEISEMEIELKEGNQEDLAAFGEKIREKYGLIPESRSKFSRAKDI